MTATHKLEINMPDGALGFLHAMCEIEALDRENMLYLLEKPWKYDAEYSAWIENGKPREAGDDGYLAFASSVLGETPEPQSVKA